MFCWDTLGAGIDVDATRHTPTAQTLVPQQEKVPPSRDAQTNR